MAIDGMISGRPGVANSIALGVWTGAKRADARGIHSIRACLPHERIGPDLILCATGPPGWQGSGRAAVPGRVLWRRSR